ncbi:MAG: bifunctional demethylmenaquinone methyltransferase/2-methoxy-6-polyprenyl-1,4-benzoquinol methylase UbiE [Magnetovibrionaceae bacterium]
MTSEKTTHFGFRDVPEDEKAGLVRNVFDSVAGRYDLMNDLMSMGVHRLWKADFLDQVRPRAEEALIDVGGGTGDIAFGWRKRGGGPVTVVDINAEMLAVGRDRAIDKGYLDGLEWVNGDAERLPLPDSRFDCYTIAFCIRNVTHIEAVLADAQRVLKPGGRFLCLEFSQVVLPLLDQLYDRYSFQLLPRLGQWVAGDRDSYQYLAESIRKFPPQKRFAGMIRDAGFDLVKYRNLSGGIAAIHSGWKV